ncbi:hypothetical protein [Roseibium sp.]|uniref:hypothetical protein n=1 Tax=Roseibium sp. TaxID=1936156 RepID=UPI003D129CDC
MDIVLTGKQDISSLGMGFQPRHKVRAATGDGIVDADLTTRNAGDAVAGAVALPPENLKRMVKRMRS